MNDEKKSKKWTELHFMWEKGDDGRLNPLRPLVTAGPGYAAFDSKLRQVPDRRKSTY
jgi:hypothetical protein